MLQGAACSESAHVDVQKQLACYWLAYDDGYHAHDAQLNIQTGTIAIVNRAYQRADAYSEAS